MQVLIIDDEIEICKSIKRYFSFFDDIELIFASSFEEAMTCIQTYHPRMYVIDINLPDGNGLKLIKKIKQNSPANQVVVVTGASDLNRVFEALEEGANDYLVKPIDMALLRKIITEAIERFKRWYELIKMELHLKQKT